MRVRKELRRKQEEKKSTRDLSLLGFFISRLSFLSLLEIDSDESTIQPHQWMVKHSMLQEVLYELFYH